MNIFQENLPITFLKPGEIKFSRKPDLIVTVLGSCVAIVLYSKVHRVGAMCHGVMPTMKQEETVENRFKYVDQSFLYMVKYFQKMGIDIKELEVKVFGGSETLRIPNRKSRLTSVGKSNVHVAFNLIEKTKMNLTAFDVGGHTGRKIYFYTETGEVLLKRLR